MLSCTKPNTYVTLLKLFERKGFLCASTLISLTGKAKTNANRKSTWNKGFHACRNAEKASNGNENA